MKNKLHLNLLKTGGRNNTGHITTYTIAGGVKKKYRLIDFKRMGLLANSFKQQSFTCSYNFGFILRIEKDPNRSSYIALICYPNGILCYIIATEKMKIGMKIYNFFEDKDNVKTKQLSLFPQNKNKIISMPMYFQVGNSFILDMLPSGILVNNLELYPKMGSTLNRAAGVWAQIIKKYDINYVQIKLKSGEHRLIHNQCRVVLGVVSNIYNNQNKLVKAGQSRLLGIKPHVRGRAMNPVDHPHGGRTNGGTIPKTPWGFLTKGRKTRHTVNTNSFIIIKRKK